MANWKPIEPNHPYLKHFFEVEGKPWEGSYLHRIYQPIDGNWPLYDLHVHRHEQELCLGVGVSISASVKWNMQSWWATCSGFEPIPCELAVELVNMILKGAEQ
jgi:hypothetical protein